MPLSTHLIPMRLHPRAMRGAARWRTLGMIAVGPCSWPMLMLLLAASLALSDELAAMLTADQAERTGPADALLEQPPAVAPTSSPMVAMKTTAYIHRFQATRKPISSHRPRRAH